MIQAVTTPAYRAAFLERIAGKPYFASVMGTPCALFADNPASGWQFYLLPGTGALTLRGGTATLCGDLPAGEEGQDAAEELQGFLRFLRIDRMICREMPLPGWQRQDPLLLWELPRGGRLPLPPAPPEELKWEEHPAMLPVSRLVFPEQETEQDSFYSMACTTIAHGQGCCRALLWGGQPVCTVGSYAGSETEAYMAAGVTAPEWRGRGLAGWLIVHLANELATARTVRFASEPSLAAFYRRLGFIQAGRLENYTQDWNHYD